MDKDIERGLFLASAEAFKAKVQPSMLLSQHCGNMYAGGAHFWAALICHLEFNAGHL